jgi:hypothetical protein
MMSTAMVVSVGTELGTTRSGASEREDGEGMSFAESFGESAGLSIDGRGKGTAGGLASETKDERNVELSKDLEESGPASDGTRGKMIAGQGMKKSEVFGNTSRKVPEKTSGNVLVSKNPVAVLGRTVGGVSSGAGEHLLMPSESSLRAVTKGVQATISKKATVAGPKAEEEELQSGETKEGAGRPVLAVPKLSADRDSKDLKAVSREGAGALNGALGGESQGHKKIAPEKKSEDAASVKKTEKVNRDEELKTVDGVGEMKGAEVRSTDGIGVPGAVTAQGQTLLPGAGQSKDAGEAGGLDSGEVIAVSGKTVDGAEVSRSKEIVSGKKAGVEDSGDAVNAAASQGSTAKPEGDGGMPAVAAANGGKDGDGKAAIPVVGAAVAHAGVGGNGTASEIVPGAAVGHTPGDIAGGKVQAGAAVAHAANLQAGSRDEGGVAGASEMGGMHRVLTATPTALEVGVANGTQGWLKIRAEMTEGGQVNASLSSATSSGQEMLHRELPALTAYLHEERVSVNAVAVQTNTAAGAGPMPAGGMNPESRGQQREQQGGGEQQQSVVTLDADRVDGGMTFEGLNGLGQDGSLSSGMFSGGGGYLNVRA